MDGKSRLLCVFHDDSNHAKSFLVLLEIFTKTTEAYQCFSTRVVWSVKRATCLFASLDLGDALVDYFMDQQWTVGFIPLDGDDIICL